MMNTDFVKKYRLLKKQINIIDAAQTEAYFKKLQNPDSNDLTIVDGTAVIPIRGSLSNRHSFFSFLFDGELDTYPSIISMLRSADANPDVTQIQLRVDSPGGRLDGLFDLLNTIKSVSKPIEALVEGRADSAAYGIVSQADKIIANSEMSEIGSIGVGTSFWVDKEMVDITSSDAPNKWPDVSTEKGVKVVKKELDKIHEKFAEIIAEGRSVATGKKITAKIVNAKFGQGGTMLADAGLDAGMVDEIIPPPERVSNAAFFNNSEPAPSGLRSGTNKTEKKMDIKEFKSKYPDVYQAAAQAGRDEEREEISALLKMGKSSGKIDYAIECIKKGKKLSQPTVQAEFLSAQLNKNDVDNRNDDDPDEITSPDTIDDKAAEAALVKGYLARRKEKRIA